MIRRHISPLRVLPGTLLAAFLASCSDKPGPTEPSVPPRPSMAVLAAATNGKIAFVSARDGNTEIYVMNAEGSDQTNLTNHPASDGSPAWSPDGTKLAFSRQSGVNSGLFVMNADGSGQTQLTSNDLFFEGEPSWSPDGTKIAFTSSRDGNSEIYVMNADGSGQTNLTNHPRGDKSPAWSPEGTIAFLSDRDLTNFAEIYVMNADGSGQTRLTNNTAFDEAPDWSPDGTKLAFMGVRDEQQIDILVMNANGSGETNLTNHPASDGGPAWSPDGTKIVFASQFREEGLLSSGIYVMNADGSGVTNLTHSDDHSPAWQPLSAPPPAMNGKIAFSSGRDGNGEIYVMNPDGSGQTNLTNNPANEDTPAWSPDGLKLAFASDRDGNAEIYVMNADGTAQTRLTNNPASDRDPAWSPDGSKVAFASDRDGNSEVYVMNADGTAQTNLTNNPALDNEPTWSPDGMKLAFTSHRDGSSEIYVMNADGSAQTRLTSALSIDDLPAWSPDGSKLVFHSTRGGGSDLWVMNADGSGQTNLTNTNNPFLTFMPAWSPDGTKLALSRDLDIYVINADGTQPTNLTNSPAAELWPAWGVRLRFLDREPPVLTVPADMTVEATSAAGAVVTYTATATDNIDPAPVVSCDRASGATFALGNTVVTCTATDATGNTATASFVVTVVDTTLPVLSLPADFAVDATSPSGAVVSYTVSASDAVSVPTISCTPASGSLFAIGTLSVSCTATDASGNSTAGSFVVVVQGAEEQITELETSIAGLDVPDGTQTSLTQKLAAASSALAEGDRDEACDVLKALINEVNAQSGKKIDATDAAALTAETNRIRGVIGC